VQLVSPRGAIAAQKRVLARDGIARNDFALPGELDGGEYTITLLADDGTQDSRKIIINTYEAPRLQKTLEFLRKAYGEGDVVNAAIEVKRATGEPFGERALTGVVTVDEVELQRIAIKTDKDGKAGARFQLPAKLQRGDGLLTILAEERRHRIDPEAHPDRGEDAAVLAVPRGRPRHNVPAASTSWPGRSASPPMSRAVRRSGSAVAEFRSVHDGRGASKPAAPTAVIMVITKPAGITAKFDVPSPASTVRGAWQ
jgi:hypothetical protein